MKKVIITLVCTFSALTAFTQNENGNPGFNFGFERIPQNAKLPDGWFKWGDYNLSIDTVEKHSGKVSLLIQPEESGSENTFGCIALAIPAKYKGKAIEVRAWMKLQNVAEGSIGLLLRIDGDGGTLGFDNMQRKNIRGTSDWALYSVRLPLPDNAEKIYVGALLSGSGKLWADDFQVLIDGKDISKAKLKTKSVYKADQDKEFDQGSGISSINLTSSKIEDLDLLGRVWGFLKYYHPEIAKGNYNWDYELFRILPKIIESKNETERNEILSKWIEMLGTLKKEKIIKIDSANTKIIPDLEWIENETKLGKKLSGLLIHIKNAKRKNENYYVGLAPYVGNPIFKNERAYSKMNYPDAGFRLLSLYRYWNIIQYYFPDKQLIGENWNDVLKEFIPVFVNASNELEYKLAVLSLISKVHDTHANIWSFHQSLVKFKGVNYAGIKVKFIENKAVVAGIYYYRDSIGSSVLQEGDIIETVNDKRVNEMVKNALPYTPASNYATQLRDIAYDLLRTNDSTLNITYKHGDITNKLRLECSPGMRKNIYDERRKKDTCFRWLTPDIACLYPGNIQNEYLKKIMPSAMRSKGLVIDFRCYPGDFVVFTLNRYLLPKCTSFAKFSKGNLKLPGLFTYTKCVKAGRNNKDYYKGKIVILVNEITQSSAEYHTMAFRVAPNVTVIGSTTAGADGNVSDLSLPGGISSRISGIGVYYQDGRETQRVGIVPDIYIEPTIKGIREGKDEVMEKAISIIEKEK